MSEPVWLLPSVGRPEMAAEVLAACAEMGMTQRGVLWADGDDYRGVPLPQNWRLISSHPNRGIGPVMNDVFHHYPNASHYGWLADDTYPRTRRFDEKLTNAADSWNLAYADDAGYLTVQEDMDIIRAGGNLTSGLCWAGNLVRTVGWWAVPGLRQAYIDVAWCDIIAPLRLARFRPEVTVEHKHWKARKRQQDDWDRLTSTEDSAIVRADLQVYTEWKRTGYKPALLRIQQAMRRHMEGLPF